MKIIDKSPIPTPTNGLSRFVASLQYGSGFVNDMEAQEVLISNMKAKLDSRFVLLRNVKLPGPDVPIPMILVSPSGVIVMVASPLRGVYRAKEDTWLRMDGGTRKAVKPNLITRTQLFGAAVEAHLTRQGVKVNNVQTSLVFVHPGMHVDSVNPVTRVVLSDAVDRFINGIAQETALGQPVPVENVVDALVPQAEQQPAATAETAKEDDYFALRSNEGEPQPYSSPMAVQATQPAKLPLGLSGTQWGCLGVLAIIWLFALIAFAVALLIQPF